MTTFIVDFSGEEGFLIFPHSIRVYYSLFHDGWKKGFVVVVFCFAFLSSVPVIVVVGSSASRPIQPGRNLGLSYKRQCSSIHTAHTPRQSLSLSPNLVRQSLASPFCSSDNNNNNKNEFSFFLYFSGKIKRKSQLRELLLLAIDLLPFVRSFVRSWFSLVYLKFQIQFLCSRFFFFFWSSLGTAFVFLSPTENSFLKKEKRKNCQKYMNHVTRNDRKDKKPVFSPFHSNLVTRSTTKSQRNQKKKKSDLFFFFPLPLSIQTQRHIYY